MKTKISLLSVWLGIALLPCLLSAQKAGEWAVGVGFQPFLYWKYNKSDWNNRPLSYPESPNKFNGLAVALTATRAISDLWGLGAELAFSRQKQAYNTSVIGHMQMDGSTTYDYAKGSFTRLDYVKIPVYAFINLELGYESGLFLKVMGGPQVALNTDYYSEYKQFGFDPISRKVLMDVINNTIINTPNHHHQDFVNNDGSHYIHGEDTKYLYKRVELGVIGSIALQKRIFQSYTVSLGARYELGLTDIENPKEDKGIITFGGLTGSDGLPDPRPATHNRRFVLEIGVSRIIE
jgi:hypothetical protein